MWTGLFFDNTSRVDADLLLDGLKKMRFQKDPAMCWRGLNIKFDGNVIYWSTVQ